MSNKRRNHSQVLSQSPSYRNQGGWNIEWAIVEIWG